MECATIAQLAQTLIEVKLNSAEQYPFRWSTKPVLEEVNLTRLLNNRVLVTHTGMNLVKLLSREALQCLRLLGVPFTHVLQHDRPSRFSVW